MTPTPDPAHSQGRHWPRRLVLTSAGLVFVTAGALVGVGGAGTDPGSTVYACVDNDKGTVRVVSGTTTCNKNESLRTWAVTGPPGAQGDPGVAGRDGAAAAGPSGPHQVVVATMTVEGITGPNADGSINLLSFNEGLTAPVAGGGGTSIGKPTFTDVTVVKSLDAVSPELLRRAATARPLPKVVIGLFQPRTTTVVATYEFTDLVVSSDTVDNDGSSPGQLLETIRLHFRTVTFTVGAATFSFDTSRDGA